MLSIEKLQELVEKILEGETVTVTEEKDVMDIGEEIRANIAEDIEVETIEGGYKISV